jgi:carbonic anhydrase
MKLDYIRQLFSLVVYFNLFSFLNSLSSKTHFSVNNKNKVQDKSLFEVYDQMSEGEGNSESQPNLNPTADPSPYVLNIGDPTVHLEAWMSIKSAAFNDKRLFPKISGLDKTKQNMLFGVENERYNEQHEVALTEGANSDFNFWFKMRGNQIYYFGTKTDINMLGSILVKDVQNSFDKFRYSTNRTHNETCFEVEDPTHSKYKLCAQTEEDKLKFMCSLQKFFNKPLDMYCDPTRQATVNLPPPEPTIKLTNIIQPVIIIPKEGRDCNDKWTYDNQGQDWECQCSEGKEQSPIDLPDKDSAILSEDRPVFTYEMISKDSSAFTGTLEGMMGAGKPARIMYDRGALRIHHPNMGKLVQLDGSVYQAQEISFHTPSEHKINGVQYDMEMQIVHYGISKGDIARQAILCILFKKKASAYNKFLEKLDFFNLPNPIDKFRELSQDIFIPYVFYNNDEDDIPSMRPFSFFTYNGSLTAPPCTERTTVYVTADPIELSGVTIELFKEALKIPDMTSADRLAVMNSESPDEIKNNRDVQPMNERMISVFDHVKFNCPDYRQATKHFEPKGHYEKRTVNVDTYVYVNGNEVSGLAGSYVVSPDESSGKAAE